MFSVQHRCFIHTFVYTALRKIDGSFILNGDWRLSWPGIYDGAGAKFYYTRQDTKSLESVVSSGPLDEPVDLMVCVAA
jgi:hypothetical protein